VTNVTRPVKMSPTSVRTFAHGLASPFYERDVSFRDRGVARGGQSHPQSPLKKKNYKERTTYSIYNIHIAH